MKLTILLSLFCLFCCSCKSDLQTKTGEAAPPELSEESNILSEENQTKLQQRLSEQKNRILQSTISKGDTAAFKIRDRKTHTLSILGSSMEKQVFDSLVLYLYGFNRKYYSEKELSVSVSPLFKSKEKKAVRVSTFDDKLDAMTYYRKLVGALDSLDKVANIKEHVYVIHAYNSRQLRDSSALSTYQAFFEKEYLNFNSDSLRSNFDITTLYNNRDTSGYYVCLIAEDNEEFDYKSTRKSISDYNKMHFGQQELWVHGRPYAEQNDTIVFSIGGFKEESIAIKYFNQLVEKSSESSADTEMKDNLFIISNKNFFAMMTENSIDDYLNFYREEYKDKLQLTIGN